MEPRGVDCKHALTGVAVGLALSLIPATSVAAQSAFVAGTGTSSAGVGRLQVRTSGAAIGFGLGVARTRFAGAQGNADAASVDLGLFDTLAKAPLACGYSFDSMVPPGAIPARVTVSSGDGATEERTAAFGEGSPVQLGSQYGAAKPNASAAAAVTGLVMDLPGLFTLAGGAAASTAELIPGTRRQASAESTVAGLSLAGGLVQLNGLRWNAAHRTGSQQVSTAAFSVSSLRVGDRVVPSADPSQLQAAIAAANLALAPSGLTLFSPKVTRTERGASVSPLRLSVSATPTVRAAIGPTLIAAQPLRSQLLALVEPLKASPECGAAKALGFGYLAVDLASLVLGEGGALDLDLGGAAAGTDAVAFANPFGAGTAPAVGGVIPMLPAEPDPLVVPRVTTRGAAPIVAAAPSIGEAVRIADRPVTLTPASVACHSMHEHGGDCTGGSGRVAAWITFALVALLAGADRLRSRLT